jgi:hypothetical protein
MSIGPRIVPGIVAFLAVVPFVLAQDKPGDEKKPDGPAKTVKTLAFDKVEGWKVERSGGMIRAKYEAPAAEGDPEGAEVFVIHVGPKDTFEKELDFWASHAQDKDGKKFDKSAIKQDAFEAGGFKVRTGELSGIVQKPRKPKKSDKDDDGDKDEKKPADAPSTFKLLGCYIDGPDGGWVVKLTGRDKSFDKARDDFLKFVKTVHVVDGPAETPKNKRKDDDDED